MNTNFYVICYAVHEREVASFDGPFDSYQKAAEFMREDCAATAAEERESDDELIVHVVDWNEGSASVSSKYKSGEEEACWTWSIEVACA